MTSDVGRGGSDRWTRRAEGEDPNEIDRERRTTEHAEAVTEGRQVSHDEERDGGMGVSSEHGGRDPGGYPHEADPAVAEAAARRDATRPLDDDDPEKREAREAGVDRWDEQDLED